jgi:para-nitrobenzyl esterase
MAFLRRVVRPICWRLPLAVTLGFAAAVAGLGAGAGTAAASSVPAGLPAGRPAAAETPAWSAPLVVRTDKGAVRGLHANNAREFFGIPYAAPPVGALRWRPPHPAAPWPGVRNATSPGSTCAQIGSIATGVITTSTSEDCLYLNVYTPTVTGRGGLPVMVWIHGGGFTGGAGSIYDGSVLAAQGHVIVVTINYRLGAFGFLALPGLDRKEAGGDFGLLDQQAALRWVQRNARAFGGNPHDVTEFGESAGAASVCDNMASPAAAGLFARAIAESGCLLSSPSRQAAETTGRAFAARLGCADIATQVACLRGKSVAGILQAQSSFGWAPVAGTPVLPLQPAAAFAAGRYTHVPLLQGTNHDEGRFFVALGYDLAGHPLTAAQYAQVIQASYGASAAAVLAQYPLSGYASPDLAYAQVITDSAFSCPALLADQLARRSGVYAYEFSDPNPPDDFNLTTLTFPLGAAHSTELQYVFQRIPFLDTVPPFSAAQLALSSQMIAYWTRFAATGSPDHGLSGGSGLRAPYWPRFSASRPDVQELVPRTIAQESSAQFAASHRCAFWAGIGASTAG